MAFIEKHSSYETKGGRKLKKCFVLISCVLFTFYFASCNNANAMQERTQHTAKGHFISDTKKEEKIQRDTKDYGQQTDTFSTGQQSIAEQSFSEENGYFAEDTEMKLNIQIGQYTFTATLQNNAAADAFVQMLTQKPIVMKMRDYSGFEKVGSLGTTLPTDNSQMTARPGDIVLYNGNQIVLFYGSNSWSYTKLGEVEDISQWENALGSGNVTVTFSIESQSD